MDKKPKETRRLNLLIPVVIILCLMVVMVFYTSKVIQDVSVANIHEVGDDRISGAAAELENYLEMTKSTLWVTADTVDHMIRTGASTQDILDYITEESANQVQYFDENYTGIYGYVKGEYLDGMAWVPPEGYDPKTRDWYLAAVEAKGDTTIVSPYVDAQTNSVIISICRLLSNGTDVLSLDVMMTRIQDSVSDLQIKGKGYGYILNSDGMIIAHRDESRKGHFITDTEEGRSFFSEVEKVRDGNFETVLDGQKSTVFVHPVLDQWYLVITAGNQELFAEVWQQMAVNILICTVIFALIAFFYFLGHRNEQNYSRRIEEIRTEEQKKAYEAKALKLEKDAADQANKAKSDFLADMSHEIRTPINAVLGMNEMILRESLDSRNSGDPAVRESFSNISEYSRNIESAGNNLLSIINDILDFSKIEAGKLDIMEERYQMSSVLNDLSNIIFFKAKDKGLDFTIDVDETLPDVLYGDEVRIRQIITNILNNAVKYTEKGSIRLTLRGDLHGPAVPGQTIRLTAEIEDTGVGIRQEDLDKLFTKFQRLDLNQNSTVEGTGLGLAITHSLLKMMGGSIDVKSEYGKGSVFTVTVPQKVLSAEPVGDFHTRFRKKVQETKAYTETFRAPGARILIVDDTKMNLTVAVGLLKSTMIRIDTAGGGEEGCEMALTTPYDLILMDQRMPKMDGVEALHIIRSQPGGRNHDTPVICLTADAVKGARERYIAEGFTDYLTKPVDSGPLEEMLAAYLPPEKVIRMQVETPEPDARQSAEDGKYEPLRRAGIDTKSGLGYCQNDRELYRSLLLEYAGSAQSKSEEIDRAYEAKDWRNYSIPVHSLKSSSRMIGATMLSGMAAELESAADDGRAYDISEGHVRMLRCYAEIVQAIRETFRNEEENSPDGENEDEILEFLPDGD